MSATAGVWGQAWADADDATLLEHVRGGDSEAYAELWRRHLPAAYGVAHRYRGRASAEDIVGEASLRVYDLIRAGKGPTSNFRSYFLTSVKTVAVDMARTDLRAVPTETEDLEVAADAVQAYDPGGRVDQQLVRTAFRRLPERDQQVLWHTAVEGTSPAVVASTMGMTANGVSVVALRARDTLRARYLDAHADRAIERAEDEECRWVLSQLGRYVRGKLPVRQRARVEQHLQDCPHAQAVLLELAEVNRGLPALMVPLIFVAGSATAAAWVGAAAAGASGPDAAKSPTSVVLAGSAAGFVGEGGRIGGRWGARDRFRGGSARGPGLVLPGRRPGPGRRHVAGGSGSGGGSGAPDRPRCWRRWPGGGHAERHRGRSAPLRRRRATRGQPCRAGGGFRRVEHRRPRGRATTPARSTTPSSVATPAVPVPPFRRQRRPTGGSTTTTSGSADDQHDLLVQHELDVVQHHDVDDHDHDDHHDDHHDDDHAAADRGTAEAVSRRVRSSTACPSWSASTPAVPDGGTLTATISSGTIWVAGCQGQARPPRSRASTATTEPGSWFRWPMPPGR